MYVTLGCGILGVFTRKNHSKRSGFRLAENVRIAGCVITRQRPQTAHGFIFLSLEDETGIANAIITPAFYAENTMTVHELFVCIEGVLQNKDNVVHVRAGKIMPLAALDIQTHAHNFH